MSLLALQHVENVGAGNARAEKPITIDLADVSDFVPHWCDLAHSSQKSLLRIYFGKDGDSIIVLLLGGSKASQARDIRRAHGFWRDYLEAK